MDLIMIGIMTLIAGILIALCSRWLANPVTRHAQTVWTTTTMVFWTVRTIVAVRIRV